MANTHSVAFDGVDGKISVGHSGGIYKGLATGTLEFWYKATHSTIAYQKLIFANGNIDIGLTQDFGGGNCKLFGEIAGAGNLGEFEEADHADGTWRHVAITWDGTWVRGYIDGVYKKRVAQSGSMNNNDWGDLCLGRRETTEPLEGNIDEFRISDIARYTTETSFTPQTTDFTNDGNTVVLWHLNDGSGTNANDSSSNNVDGTLSGGASWDTDIPFIETAIKTVNGLAKASVKTYNGLAIASVKTINGLA